MNYWYLQSNSVFVFFPHRVVYLGLTLGLRTLSFIFCIWGFALLKKHLSREEKKALTNGSAEMELLRKEENSCVHGEPFILGLDCDVDRETDLWALVWPNSHGTSYYGAWPHLTVFIAQRLYLYMNGVHTTSTNCKFLCVLNKLKTFVTKTGKYAVF